MKKIILTLSLACFGFVAFSQGDIKLSDLGVQPSNPNGPGIPDAPPPPPPSTLDKAAETWKDMGSPQLPNDPATGDKAPGIQITLPIPESKNKK